VLILFEDRAILKDGSKIDCNAYEYVLGFLDELTRNKLPLNSSIKEFFQGYLKATIAAPFISLFLERLNIDTWQKFNICCFDIIRNENFGFKVTEEEAQYLLNQLLNPCLEKIYNDKKI